MMILVIIMIIMMIITMMILVTIMIMRPGVRGCSSWSGSLKPRIVSPAEDFRSQNTNHLNFPHRPAVKHIPNRTCLYNMIGSVSVNHSNPLYNERKLHSLITCDVLRDISPKSDHLRWRQEFENDNILYISKAKLKAKKTTIGTNPGGGDGQDEPTNSVPQL